MLNVAITDISIPITTLQDTTLVEKAELCCAGARFFLTAAVSAAIKPLQQGFSVLQDTFTETVDLCCVGARFFLTAAASAAIKTLQQGFSVLQVSDIPKWFGLNELINRC